jgi:hypothetical protein
MINYSLIIPRGKGVIDGCIYKDRRQSLAYNFCNKRCCRYKGETLKRIKCSYKHDTKEQQHG